MKPRRAARRHLVAAALVCVVLVAAAGATVWSIGEALEERQVATAAAKLRIAARTVASADSLNAAGADPSFPDLGSAVAELNGDHDLALHALEPAERLEAEHLLVEIAGCGSLLLAPGAPDHRPPPHDHDALQDLLIRSSTRATAEASAAERRAMISLLVAAAAAGVAGWFLLRARTSELRLRGDLYRQANTDLLTGLPNRRALDRVLDNTRSRMESTGCTTALIFLDLDGFKEINDTLGHSLGDELLSQVAERLRGTRQGDDVLLRLGGDEFAVLLPAVDDPAAAQRAAHRYLHVLDRPFSVDNRVEHLRGSIGVTITSDPARVPTLTTEADVAMYEAKRTGGHRVVVFEPSMEVDANATSRITRALRAADYDTEFSVVYQPIVTVAGTTITGYEALLRWTSPTLGSVGPNEFIPVAERSGEIGPIGQWVLEAVCKQLNAWADTGLAPDATVSCNVSPHQLAQEDFVAHVLDALDTWDVPPHRLVIEVTESAVLDHSGVAVQRLHELRHAGIRISIDDFGSGYSNLGQLLQLPFDIIKIDRSLLLILTEMREDPGSDGMSPGAIMEAIVSIAGVFDAPVICEGVETEQQRLFLEASGVTHVQGYLTGRPAPPEEVRRETARPRGAAAILTSSERSETEAGLRTVGSAH